MGSSHLYASITSACLLLCAGTSLLGDTLEITSTPSGATVEINGEVVGHTPYREEHPGSHFGRPKTILSKRLDHGMVARVSLPGYTTKELQLTDGPKDWVSIKGRRNGQYWTLRKKSFHAELALISDVFTGRLELGSSVVDRPLRSIPDVAFSIKEVASRTKPAIVELKGIHGRGSGFLITETGVIATNAHVIRDEEIVLASFSDGRQFPAKVLESEEGVDIGFVKIEGTDFLYLPLAPIGEVRQGDPVVAFGSPGGGMPFSITQGVVGGIDKLPGAGPGTWIQTDAVINPGNSGGPLLNLRGEVIGITAERLATRGGGGLSFALSSSDLLAVLRKLYPDLQGQMSKMSDESSGALDQKGIVEFQSTERAEIRIDGQPWGNTPATIPLSAGRHHVVIKRQGHTDWITYINVAPGGHQTLVAPE